MNSANERYIKLKRLDILVSDQFLKFAVDHFKNTLKILSINFEVFKFRSFDVSLNS